MSDGSNSRRGPKKKKCESFIAFEKNIKRSESFIAIFDSDRPQGRPKTEHDDLLRGAVVFAIGALDHFIHELILEIVPRFGGNASAMKDALAAISRSDPGLALRVAIAKEDRAQKEFRGALEQWLESKSFQGVAKIIEAMGYLGIKLDELNFPTGWEPKLKKFTTDRHSIVHKGTGVRVTLQQAKDCTDLVKTLGSLINEKAVTFYH
ncbi:MAG: HEPN domain-containing protein [Rhodoglobus sp.]